MNLFDQLVTEALKNQPDLSTLRIVVEKELLHHDVLRVLSHNNLLANLTFIGGTCLRCCYGGIRLSEDLDFTGGSDLTRASLSEMGQVLIENLNDKYGLLVKVSEPIKDKGNVDTWKIKVETRPGQKHLPAQCINIDICAVPSYEKRPMMLLNPYGVDMGTSGLIIQAQSREEIYADKLMAFALRPNRIKYRDLWDMVWLHQQRLKPKFELIPNKLRDRNYRLEYFLNLFNDRKQSLIENNKISLEFKQEMRRFLSSEQVNQIVEKDNLWDFITYLIEDLGNQLHENIRV
jgi:predicted nucleotidyltransferase component of viral defense system